MKRKTLVAAVLFVLLTGFMSQRTYGEQSVKPWTLMVYMNGSDLESEDGAATVDLMEILDSGLNSENANIVVFTGGALRWQNDVVPSNECALWELADGMMYEIMGIGLRNMGDPTTLADFINYAVENYPAEQYGLIMWDHGGGAIAGYGSDEQFGESNLTLSDMNYAFSQTSLASNKLEMLGFDSCLMGTVEMAVVAQNYARYLVASEDLEPTDGWDYSFLAALNQNPGMSGAELGICITDYFMDYYGNTDEDLNLSVVDLSQAGKVMEALGALTAHCSESLLADSYSSFRQLAGKRGRTKTFGSGSPLDSESDMVDAGDMATKLSDMYPEEAQAVLQALDAAVVYNSNNASGYLSGLSAWYIYNGKDTGQDSLELYSQIGLDENYTWYLHAFYENLTSSKRRNSGRSRSSNKASQSVIISEEDILNAALTVWRLYDGIYVMTGMRNGWDGLEDMWPVIGELDACLYWISGTDERSLFAVPAERNGRDCDIIIAIGSENPEGRILGVRNEEGYIVQKGFDEIKDGDTFALYYQARDAENGDASWVKSETFTVTGELSLRWQALDSGVYYCHQLTDIWNDKYFTELSRY